MIDTSIKVSEYQARRKKVLNALKGSAGVVFAGEGAPPLRGEWFPNFDFKYLTGISNEPGACVIFDPTNPDPRRKIMLRVSALLKRWETRRMEVAVRGLPFL